MNMKKSLLCAALILSSSAAFAGNGYAGLSAGSSTHKVSTGGLSVSDDTLGVKVYAGLQVNEAFGIEAGYAHFGKSKISAEGDSLGAKPTSFYVAATGTFKASPQFDVFGKVGVARSDTNVYANFDGESGNVDQSGTSAIFGVGLKYKLSETMSLVAEYENFGKVAKADDADLNLKVSLVSVGLRIAF
jgi:OOP family OmpA-OmpF porin